MKYYGKISSTRWLILKLHSIMEVSTATDRLHDNLWRGICFSGTSFRDEASLVQRVE
jgi:hypothetical protein